MEIGAFVRQPKESKALFRTKGKWADLTQYEADCTTCVTMTHSSVVSRSSKFRSRTYTRIASSLKNSESAKMFTFTIFCSGGGGGGALVLGVWTLGVWTVSSLRLVGPVAQRGWRKRHDSCGVLAVTRTGNVCIASKECRM